MLWGPPLPCSVQPSANANSPLGAWSAQCSSIRELRGARCGETPVVVRIPDSSCGCVSNKLNWGRKWCYDSAAGAGRNQPDEDYCRLFAAVFWQGSSWSRVELETKVHPKVLEDFTIMDKATSRAFSWLKATTSLSYLRYYAKWMLTPR